VNATEENFVSGKAAVEEDDYLIYDSQTGKLYYDADGAEMEFAAILIAGIKGAGAKGLTLGQFGIV
jgi:serralysin